MVQGHIFEAGSLGIKGWLGVYSLQAWCALPVLYLWCSFLHDLHVQMLLGCQICEAENIAYFPGHLPVPEGGDGEGSTTGFGTRPLLLFWASVLQNQRPFSRTGRDPPHHPGTKSGGSLHERGQGIGDLPAWLWVSGG